MKICLIAPNDGLNDPRARVTWHVLKRAGHEVRFVTAGAGNEPGVITVAPRPTDLLTRFRHRSSTPAQRAADLSARLAAAAKTTGASIYVPTDPRALGAAIEAAGATGGAVSRTPQMSSAGDVDLIDIAPRHPEAASPVSGFGTTHTPTDDRPPYRPESGRHRDKSVVLCYRRSEINPGRYLEAALRRAGVRLRVETESIDLGTVGAGTDLVLFVEGPYPALEVGGKTDVTTLFWAHHGEHHLHANLRLTERYRADAVLLAHSWHLAFWFPTPVYRFPFGYDPTLLRPGKQLGERRYDVAMVGAGLTTGGQYGRRQQLVAALRSAIPPERLGFGEQVSAEEMAALYADSRIVINEGGTRHYPITMRVLETVGSGAVLLSDPLPGMEMLLLEGEEYVSLGSDVVASVERILDDLDDSQAMADRALETAQGLHSYDHRVDELFSIAATTRKRNVTRGQPLSGLAGVIDDDVEVQRLAHWNVDELVGELPDREVWDARTMERSRLAPGKMESVAIRSESVADLGWLLDAARRYAYVEGSDDLREYLSAEQQRATTSEDGGITRIDFHAPSYRIMDFEETPT